MYLYKTLLAKIFKFLEKWFELSRSISDTEKNSSFDFEDVFLSYENIS